MRYTQLTKGERYQISAYLAFEYSQQEIAEVLGHSPATISRELKRSSTRKGYYVESAQQRADKRKQSHRHVQITDETWQQVEQFLRQDWSPEQINGRLKNKSYPRSVMSGSISIFGTIRKPMVTYLPIYAGRKNARSIMAVLLSEDS